MEIICDNCQARLNIPDERIPKGKKASFPCPKCKHRLQIVPREMVPGTPNAKPVSRPRNNLKKEEQKKTKPVAAKETADYNASDRPFDFLDEDARTALLCIEKKPSEKITHKVLDDMGYHIEIVRDTRTALKRMKYHLFNIIVLDEAFDHDSGGMRTIMGYLNELSMAIRRRIVVILMSDRLRTMDNMAVFHASCNQIINHRDIKEMDKLLKRTIQEHEQTYTIFNESLKEAGKL